jgi:hypothetical protein
MDVHRFYDALMRGFRVRRMRRFAAQFQPGPDTRILDVGGSAFNWELAGIQASVTLLNLTPPRHAPQRPERFRDVRASGAALPYAERAFDVAFSNSVIEHVGGYAEQERFAAELRRVARGLWVQTPARSFPLETHLLTPFFHFLPRAWQARLVRRWTLWGWLARPSREQARRFVEQTHLLGYREMRRLFPDCEIRRERFLGLTKAFVAVRAGAPPTARVLASPRGVG